MTQLYTVPNPYPQTVYVPLGELQNSAKVLDADIRKLIAFGRIKGSIGPESEVIGPGSEVQVHPSFKDHLKQETIAAGGMDSLLFSDEAASLVKRITKTEIPTETLEQLVSGISLRVASRPKFVGYWDYQSETISAKPKARHRYTVPNRLSSSPGVAFGPHLVHRFAVLELIYMLDIIESDMITKTNAILENPLPTVSYPVVFRSGEYIVYIEPSKKAPENPLDNTYDGLLLKFMQDEDSTVWVDRGVQYWARIARYEHEGKHYNVVIFRESQRFFKEHFGIRDESIIKDYGSDGEKLLLKLFVKQNSKGRRPIITLEDRPKHFGAVVGLYHDYLPKIQTRI